LNKAATLFNNDLSIEVVTVTITFFAVMAFFSWLICRWWQKVDFWVLLFIKAVISAGFYF
jgi:hypothetical protein